MDMGTGTGTHQHLCHLMAVTGTKPHNPLTEVDMGTGMGWDTLTNLPSHPNHPNPLKDMGMLKAIHPNPQTPIKPHTEAEQVEITPP